MGRLGQFHSTEGEPVRAADAHVVHRGALPFKVLGEFEGGDDRRSASLGDGQGIEDMVDMPVSQQDVIRVYIVRCNCRPGVPRDERIEQQGMTPSDREKQACP